MDRPLRHGRGLRAGLAALTLILMAPAVAAAGDLPEFLRGTYSPSNTDWNGVYFGAQIGVANMDTDFGNAASQWVGNNLSNTTLQTQYNVSSWALMPSNTIDGQSYGAFVGYKRSVGRARAGFRHGLQSHVVHGILVVGGFDQPHGYHFGRYI